MPKVSEIEVKDLKLDLKNFRTVPQKKEIDAIKAMISIKPDRFFAIMESLIDDGYLPTENIIVLEDSSELIVKEGNRRIGALKLIHGFYNVDDFGLPNSILDKIKNVSLNWKKNNSKVPCSIFEVKEIDVVDRVVTLAHGKGEKASRDPWNSVARARHNRDVKGVVEHGLDLLEKYLSIGRNINNQQKDRWGGEYSITVLDEALRKIFVRVGVLSVTELVTKYPKINYLSEVENILLDIGLEQIKFETLRNSQLDFPTNYGIPPVVQPTAQASNTTGSGTSPNTTPSGQNPSPSSNSNPTQTTQPPSSSAVGANNATANPSPASPVSKPIKAVATNDPKYVAGILKKFTPKGANRQKVVTLRDELRKLKVNDTPIAFCFVLRSMFEISAKAYLKDNSISTTNSNGREKTLVDMLRDATRHLTNNNSNSAMVKILHGAMTEIGKPDGILSVTSMNQLVHNPSFSIVPSDICIMFGNIYPLLEAMN